MVDTKSQEFHLSKCKFLTFSFRQMEKLRVGISLPKEIHQLPHRTPSTPKIPDFKPFFNTFACDMVFLTLMKINYITRKI